MTAVGFRRAVASVAAVSALIGVGGFRTAGAGAATNTASISGTVRAAGTGYALPGVEVVLAELRPTVGLEVAPKLPAMIAFTYTAKNGTYSFTDLPASDSTGYWVCFDTQFINGYTIPAPPGPLRAYQDNCYLNRPGFNVQPDLAGFYPRPPAPGSTAIHVATGQQVTGIDASLANPAVTNPANAGNISGKVTQSLTGLPLRGATVVVFNPFGKVVGETLTSGQGKYTVTDVLASRFSYTVCVNGSAATGGTGLHGYDSRCYVNIAWNGASIPAGVTPLSVTAGMTTSGIKFALAAN